MRVLLDTTYLMPAIGVQVGGVPPDVLSNLRAEGHETAASEVSLLEVAAKAGKLVKTRRLGLARVELGLRAILEDPALEILSIRDERILSLAIRLRATLPDFLDCALLATATVDCEAFVTEDRDVIDLVRTAEFRSIAKPGAGFSASRWRALVPPR